MTTIEDVSITTIEDIPNDVLLIIINLLFSFERIFLRLTNKRFHSLVKKTKLEKSFIKNSYIFHNFRVSYINYNFEEIDKNIESINVGDYGTVEYDGDDNNYFHVSNYLPFIVIDVSEETTIKIVLLEPSFCSQNNNYNWLIKNNLEYHNDSYLKLKYSLIGEGWISDNCDSDPNYVYKLMWNKVMYKCYIPITNY